MGVPAHIYIYIYTHIEICLYLHTCTKPSIQRTNLASRISYYALASCNSTLIISIIYCTHYVVVEVCCQ